MKELEEIVTLDNKCIHSVLPHVNSLLQNAILTCKASDKPVEDFAKENIAPNKKLEPQWQFQQTSRAPGRKKKGLVLR